MNERPVDEHSLQEEALRIVDKKEASTRRHGRYYSHYIRVVVVYGGEVDHDNFRAGEGVMREVTAAKMNFESGGHARGHGVSLAQIELHGPHLVCSVGPKEKEAFEKALMARSDKLPRDRIIIIDEVVEDDGTRHPIEDASGLFRGVHQKITDPNSPIHEVGAVALVGHRSDFIRRGFSTRKFKRFLKDRGAKDLSVWSFAIKDRLGKGEGLEEGDFHREVEHARHEDLATEPLTFTQSQSDEKLLP